MKPVGAESDGNNLMLIGGQRGARWPPLPVGATAARLAAGSGAAPSGGRAVSEPLCQVAHRYKSLPTT